MKDVAFESGDLYYSIHKGKIKVTGKKGNDGKWKISARLTDDYDLTEIMSFMNEKKQVTLGTLANDAAVLSQNLGAITPYSICVDFNLER